MLGALGGSKPAAGQENDVRSTRHAWLHTAGWTCVLAVAAYLIVIGRSVRNQNADSLIPIFVSLESWSLFYWGQDRFGMLTPLLALPLRDSFLNLLLQNFLTVFILLAGMVAVCRRLGVTPAPLFGVVFAIVLLALEQDWIVTLLLTTNQSYGPAIGCFGLAAYFCRYSSSLSLVATLALMLVGAWTNGGVAIFMTILGAALLFVRRTWQFSLPFFACALLSVGGHQVLQTFAPARLQPFGIPAVTDVPQLLADFWTSVYRMLALRGVLGTALLWVLAIAVTWRDRTWGLACSCLGALTVAAVVYGSVMAVFLGGLDRHFMAAFPVCVAAPILILATTVRAVDWIPTSILQVTRTLAVPIVLACLLVQTGPRRPETVRRQLITNLGRGREVQLYTRGVSAVTGDYWEVWPLVFATNLLHERQNRQRPVLPVAYRSAPLHSRIVSTLTPDAKVAIVPSDNLSYWKSVGLPPLQIASSFDGYALGTVDGQ